MTSEQFNTRYQLLKCVVDTRIRTFNAVEASSGRVVMAHFLDTGPGSESQALLSLIEGLEQRDRAKVLEIANVDGSLVLVTQYLSGFKSLGAWLYSKGRASPGVGTSSEETSAPETAPDTADAQPSPSLATGKPPGEFTKLFEPPSAPPSPAPAQTSAESDTALAASSSGPGREPSDFSRVFGGVKAPDATPIPATRPEVTDQTPAAPEPTTSQPLMPRDSPEVPTGSSVFQAPVKPPPNLRWEDSGPAIIVPNVPTPSSEALRRPPGVGLSSGSESTPIIPSVDAGWGNASRGGAAPPGIDLPGGRKVPAMPTGPSEYTRIIQGVVDPTPAVTQPPASEKPAVPPARRASLKWLVLVLVGALLLAISLGSYLALK